MVPALKTRSGRVVSFNQDVLSKTTNNATKHETHALRDSNSAPSSATSSSGGGTGQPLADQDASSSELVDAAEDDEDADKLDVSNPSVDVAESKSETFESGTTLLHASKHQRTGTTDEINALVNETHLKEKSPAQDIAMNLGLNDASSSVADDESDGAPESDFDVADDDDDYGALDNLSDTDDLEGADLEKEVEQDIFDNEDKINQEIDWNEAWTYQYDDTNHYSRGLINQHPDSLFPGHIPVDPPSHVPQDSTDRPVINIKEPLWAINDSWSSDSSASDSDHRRKSDNSALTSVNAIDNAESDDEYLDDTEDEEFIPPTISSPAMSLSKAVPKRSRSVPNTPQSKPRSLINMRRFTVSPGKAVAYSKKTAFGVKLLFQFSGTDNLKYITARVNHDSTRSSSVDTPAIRERINPNLFRQYHCVSSPLTGAEPKPATEFAKTFPFNEDFKPVFAQGTPLLSGMDGAELMASFLHIEAAADSEHDTATEHVATSGEIQLGPPLLSETPARLMSNDIEVSNSIEEYLTRQSRNLTSEPSDLSTSLDTPLSSDLAGPVESSLNETSPVKRRYSDFAGSPDLETDSPSIKRQQVEALPNLVT